MFTRLKKEVKILLLALAIGLGGAVLLGAYTFVYSDVTQRGIADEVLRFHVLAHSNAPADQDVKDAVTAAVLAELETALAESPALDATRGYITARLCEIEAVARGVMHCAGLDYDVTAQLTHRFFPTTVYGGLTFPPGRYETLLITLGSGAGRNWWCLMFPPLCYVEMTGTTHTHYLLEENLTGAGFALLTHQAEGSGTDVRVRFRLVEWWQNRRNNTPSPAKELQHAAR